ncbi:MAG: LptF/LptG family permease [Desulfovibrio sp.]|jgi:lipopolysaccharide export system permease protein|nr:LptF/LptG family permease [Desulfovibrio sp.]
MTLLARYLLRQNIFLLFTILLVGTGLYILTDMFERLDMFLESGVGPFTLIFFFVAKIPTIISLILPAVYLIALVVQMNMLERSRELVALASGGVSAHSITRFVFFYGIAWALMQLLFAQVIGVAGESVATRIWQEDVRGNSMDESGIYGLWFTDANRIVRIYMAYPAKQRGDDITVYVLDGSGIGIDEIVKARSFRISAPDTWTLEDGERLIPARYAAEKFERYDMPISQDLHAFQVGAQAGVKPSQLSLTELGDTIARLERAGSNVENLRTAWHAKLAYAASIIVMGVLALIVSRQTNNIYKAMALSILITFFYYFLNTMCVSMGEKGFISPPVAAWFANVLFFGLGTLWLAWPGVLQQLRRPRPAAR